MRATGSCSARSRRQRPEQAPRCPAVVEESPANNRSTPAGKLADAELHSSGGDLDDLELIGFSIWERRGGTGRNVTFPARQYSVNGERRAFAMLRPVVDAAAQDRVRDQTLEAYAAFEQEVARASRHPEDLGAGTQ
jgi:hypothetical protein